MNSKLIAVLVVAVVAVSAVGAFFMIGGNDKGSNDKVDCRLLVYGNADLDDDLDDDDVQTIQKIIDGTVESNKYADANQDGHVDEADKAIVQKFVAGQSATMYYDDIADGISSIQYPMTSIMGIHQHVLIPLVAMGAMPYMHGYVLHESGMTGAEMLSPLYSSQKNCCVSYNAIDIELFSDLDVKPEYVITYNTNLAAEPTLEKAGVKFVHLDFSNIYHMSEALLTIGVMMNLQENAKEYVDYVDEMIKKVADTLVEKNTVRKSVMCTYMTNCVDNKDGLHSAAAQAAGASIVTDWSGTYRSFDKGAEWLYEYTPDYLFYFASWGYTEELNLHDTYVKYADYFNDLSAYKSGRYYVFNSSMPVPIISAYIAQALYPEVFGEHYGDDFNNAFLQKFFPEYYNDAHYNAYDHIYCITAQLAGVDLNALKSVSLNVSKDAAVTASSISNEIGKSILNGLTLNVSGNDADAKLEAAAVKLIAENQSFVKVKAGNASVLLSSGVFTTLNNGKDATISVSVTTDASAIAAQLGESSGAVAMISADILSGTTAVHGLKGQATLTIPYDIGSNDVSKLNIWYKYDNGTYAQYDAVYEDGNIVFTVDHFSNFYIAFCDPEAGEPTGPSDKVNDNAYEMAQYVLSTYTGPFKTYKEAVLAMAADSSVVDAKLSAPNGSRYGNTENYLRFFIGYSAETLFNETKAVHATKIGTDVMGSPCIEIKIENNFDGFSSYCLNSSMARYVYIAGFIDNVYFEGYTLSEVDVDSDSVKALADVIYDAMTGNLDANGKTYAENLLASYNGVFKTYKEATMTLSAESDAKVGIISVPNGAARGNTENYVKFSVTSDAKALFDEAKATHATKIGTDVMGATCTEAKIMSNFDGFSSYFLNSAMARYVYVAGYLGNVYFEAYSLASADITTEDVQELADAVFGVLAPASIDAKESAEDLLDEYDGVFKTYKDAEMTLSADSTSTVGIISVPNGAARGNTENYVKIMVTSDAKALFDEAKATHATKIGTDVMGATCTEAKIMNDFSGFSSYFLNSAMARYVYVAGYVDGVYFEAYSLASADITSDDVQELADAIAKVISGKNAMVPKDNASDMASALLQKYSSGKYSKLGDKTLAAAEDNTAAVAKIFLENGASRGTTENYVKFSVTSDAKTLFADAKAAHDEKIGTDVMSAKCTAFDVQTCFDGFSGYYLNSGMAQYFYLAGYVGDVFFDGYFKTSGEIFNEDAQVLFDMIYAAMAAPVSA